VDDSNPKAMAEVCGLAKERKANERADILKKYYKLAPRSVKADGSCASMDNMENNIDAFGSREGPTTRSNPPPPLRMQ
jgi:hypothetical protein